ncbi:Hypothetical predicted protein [Paramuricea clavata]|uniref:Uncharacterized protein n=1 Tax=Paramuricea clavata TaxID=317549 RepID=A0A6S7G7P8_PARCT|nr:Hypothetical predicted protein [Paramuricea clavata]
MSPEETIAGDEKKMKVCDTMDLDPRRNCKPVNCVQKYNGRRNFFRKETKLCEPVHECYTSSDDDGLPTTAFDKDHNKCKSLIQKQLTKEEERDLKDNVESHMEASERAKFKNLGPSDSIPVRCNHGKRAGDMCVCDDGWKTDTSKVPLGDPKFVYNWCNVRTRKKPLLPYKQQKHFMIAGLSLTSFTLLVTWLWMIHRYIYPQADDHMKLIWKKTNFFTSGKKKELPDRVAETTQLFEDPILTSVDDIQSVPAMKSKSIQKGKSAFSFVKHSAKNLFSFRSLTNEKSSVPASAFSNVDDMASMSSVQQPSITDESNPSISNVSTLVQYGSSISAGHTTQDGSSISVRGRAVAQQQSLSGQMSQERSSRTGNVFPGNVQPRNSSIPDKVSHEYASNIGSTVVGQRSLQNEGGETSEILKDGNPVSSDEGVVKESSRIVASRTTRAGSTFTLAGPEDPQLMQKRLSTSSPVFDNFSDSD